MGLTSRVPCRTRRTERRKPASSHDRGGGTGLGTPLPGRPGLPVNVRSGPGTSYRIVRTLPLGTTGPDLLPEAGAAGHRPVRHPNIWDNIANGQFVSDAYVYTGSDGYVAPRCD